jgi:hypothetical protein
MVIHWRNEQWQHQTDNKGLNKIRVEVYGLRYIKMWDLTSIPF